ncbi:MAG TPA: YjjG family noncanonical pyrimidine nucleotidase [Chitinophagaceae bacterium]|nr:YjjG family noncanonical pyrimidine nucleotidase [Chitinophagaceae bacterium]MCC6634203.1 noncanonical pyrimidine nucleotidase, YjjG family [Chitinophagaceae bacterium]HNF29793.1 YjjG family noncanonical pyrimidine nucleotidase [Chitinophagaceae bacterium]HNL83066.1 YjjG family noncanonical pyrimidine nucleotidase [Chitinophagaceae bacterium]HNM33557.1 YjjG family noncanonical pyrimidine nucleotidase [Chitinophagaceae bacterium]
MKQYKHLFFDLDHTLWDLEANAKETLHELYVKYNLLQIGIVDFDLFFNKYSIHNERLWNRYTQGFIKQEELRWKRIWLTFLEYKIANEPLSKQIATDFLQILPTKKILFPYTIEILQYLTKKNYLLHLITNGFEAVQNNKLKNSNIHSFFKEVITSQGSNSLKPNKEIFEYALNKSKASVHESLMIGDNLEADIVGGINIGMDTVYVNYLNIKASNIQPTYTITHLQQLEEIL